MSKSIKKHLIFWLIPVAFLFFWYFRPIIFPFLVGLIIGSAIQSLAYYLNYRLKINYHLSVFLIYFLILTLVLATFYLIIKVLFEEAPSLLEKTDPYLRLLQNFGLKTNWQDFLSLSDYLPKVMNFLSNFLGGFISLILIFVISFYVSLSKNFPENFFSFLRLKENYFKIWRRIRRKIAFWFLGQVILMIFIGLAVYIFFGLILNIKYALLISLVAGILEVVPVLGPIISLITASIIVFIDSSSYVLPTIIFFILLQQIENHFLVPLVMRRAINLNPLFIILGILAGAKIGGILGIIIVLPFLGVIVEILSFAGSSNGRTPPSGGGNPGSSPGPAIKQK